MDDSTEYDLAHVAYWLRTGRTPEMAAHCACWWASMKRMGVRLATFHLHDPAPTGEPQYRSYGESAGSPQLLSEMEIRERAAWRTWEKYSRIIVGGGY